MLKYPLDGTLIKPDHAASLRKPDIDREVQAYSYLEFGSSPSSSYDKLVLPWCIKESTYILKKNTEINTKLQDANIQNSIKQLINKLENLTVFYDFPTICSSSKSKFYTIYFKFLRMSYRISVNFVDLGYRSFNIGFYG